MSMFTGLKAVNHFGRPDMSSFLKFVQKKHSYVSIYYLSAGTLFTVHAAFGNRMCLACHVPLV